MTIMDLLIIVAALGLGAIAKGATGMGLPLIAMPVLTSFLGIAHAISIMLVPIILTNAWQVWSIRDERSDAQMHFLLPMGLGGIAGIVIGTWALVGINERSLLLLFGGVLIAYVAFRLFRPRFVLGMRAARRAASIAGLVAGILQGATGISSPVAVTFIHSMRLGQRAHVFAVSVVFLALALVQLPVLMVSGVLKASWVVEGLFALLPALGLMPVGQKLSQRISPAAFDRLMLGGIALMGAKMITGL